MRIYKRCSCPDESKCSHAYHYVFEIHGQEHRRSTKTSNARIAGRILDKARQDVIENKGKVAPPVVTKLSAHITNYIAFTADKNVTAYKDAKVLAFLLTVIGNLPLSDITTFAIEKWMIKRLAQGVSKSTVNRELNIVKGCFTKAVGWKLLTESPTANISEYPVDNSRIRVLTKDEIDVVLQFRPFAALVCRVTLESLARLMEVVNMRKSHIGPNWIEFRRKGGRVARVPVTAKLRAALLDRCHPSGFVFGEQENGGHPPSQSVASHRIMAELAGAGICDASHHTMRHTGVTLMLEAGRNPRVIQMLAGWSSMKMLERYGHVRDAEAIQAVTGNAAYLDAPAMVQALMEAEATA